MYEDSLKIIKDYFICMLGAIPILNSNTDIKCDNFKNVLVENSNNMKKYL